MQRPTLVLSNNNDGCCVAGSDEVKNMGIKMGTPLFKIRDFVREQGIKVLSSNGLYADMSIIQLMKALSITRV